MPENSKPSEADVKSEGKAARGAAKDAAAEAESAAAKAMQGAPVTADISATQDQALHSIEAAGSAIFEGMSKAHREISEFVSERIRQEIETQSEFLRCRTFDDVREVQSKFLMTAMDQYSAEANRLMQIGADVMAQSMPRNGR